MKIAIFFAFALTVATAQTTDWAALNETMLHDLNADAFNGITPAQLGSIRTDAIPGLRADQFGAIPAASWSGLTPDQFYNLSSLICSTLSKEFFQNVAPASLQNFTVACVQVAQAGSFSGFTDQGLSNVTVESFSAFSADQVFALPEESAKSLTRSQVVALGSNADTKACVGLKASFVNNFPLDTFSDIKAACIEQFNATQIPGLAVQSVANLDAALAPVLSQDQVKALGENCAGLRPDFFSKIAFFANLTNQCVSRLPGPAFTSVTADQVKQLTVEAVNAINQAQFMNFNTEAAAGFSEAQVAAFNKDGCKGIPADFAGKLLDTSVTGLTPDCVQNANETFFAKFSAAQTTVLKLEVVKILSELQVLNFAFDATSGFTWQQINVLGYETGCKGLDSGFVGNLKVGSIDALSPDCIKNARDHAFFTLSAVQVRNLTEIAFSGFTSNQMGWFSLEAAKAVSPGQVSNLGVTTGCAGLGGEVAANFPTAVFPAISRDCLANTNATFFASLPDDSVKAITNTTIAGIQERHFEYIPARVAADFTEIQTSQFSDDACKGITAIVLGNLAPATGLKGLTSSCISNIKPFSFTLLSADQLNSLNCTVLNAEQLSFVPVATFDAISIVCIQQLTPSAFSAITPNQLEKLPTNIVALLTAAQLSQFSPLSIRNMTVAQVQALNTNATSGFTGDQLGNLTVAQGINFINALTIDRWTANPQTAMDYVAKLGVLFEGVIAFKDITNSSTWIQLANLENSTFVLDANFVSKIYPMTFMGLRPLYVPLLPEEAFKVFTKEQTAYLLPPVVSQFSGNQVKGFTPEAFGNLYPASYDALSKDALKSLTDDQIKAIPASVFKDCTFADHLQDSGRELPFTGDAKTNYDQCIAERNGGKSGLTGGQIAGIVIGSIAGAALLAGAIIYFVRRRKYSYQAI